MSHRQLKVLTIFGLIPKTHIFLLMFQSILTLIRPLEWCYTIVPVLPRALLDYVDAPGNFIYGCYSDYSEELKEVCIVYFFIQFDREIIRLYYN